MTNFTDLALEAASHWGGVARAPRLIGDRENAVFEVTLASGQRAALRLHRQGYQTLASIEAELIWTEALAEKAFPCPRPIRSSEGALVTTLPSGRPVSLVSWIDAAPIGENGVPFDGPLEAQLALYEQLGGLMARLHNITDGIDTKTFDRPVWDSAGLLGDTPLWGRFWENPALTKSEVDKLQIARKNAAQQLNDINRLETCLIHADLLQENVLKNADGLHIIDFDDSGFGYKLYDLGVALIQHAESPDLDALTQALCAGYGCTTELMPLFIMLRSMASCGWIISRAPADDPRQRFYAERALRCASRYLAV